MLTATPVNTKTIIFLAVINLLGLGSLSWNLGSNPGIFSSFSIYCFTIVSAKSFKPLPEVISSLQSAFHLLFLKRRMECSAPHGIFK